MILMFGVTYVYSVAKIAYRSIPATMKSYPHPSTSRRATRLTVGIKKLSTQLFLRCAGDAG